MNGIEIVDYTYNILVLLLGKHIHYAKQTVSLERVMEKSGEESQSQGLQDRGKQDRRDGSVDKDVCGQT